MGKRIKRIPSKRTVVHTPFTKEQKRIYASVFKKAKVKTAPVIAGPVKRSIDIHGWLAKLSQTHILGESGKISVPFGFDVVPEIPTKSVLQLKTRFYKFHTDKVWKGAMVPVGIEPIALKLNPWPSTDPTRPDEWIAVYYKNYYVRVEQNHHHPILGPHTAKLHLIIPDEQGKPSTVHEWLGTTQFDYPFTNEDRLRIQLRRAIRMREYWCSEEVEDIDVPLWTTAHDGLEMDKLV